MNKFKGEGELFTNKLIPTYPSTKCKTTHKSKINIVKLEFISKYYNSRLIVTHILSLKMLIFGLCFVLISVMLLRIICNV